MKFRFLMVGLLPFVLAACSSGESALSPSSKSQTAVSPEKRAPAKRWYQFEHVSAGAKVFQENCAACHGKRGEGAPDWKKIGPDGKYPAPPLNGTGHAWHHPLSVLFRVVKHGSPGGQGNMPPWREKLSDEEILAAIAWFQSKWRQEIYENWAKRDAASRG